MKHYIISEIIYWVIAVISMFSFFETNDFVRVESV